jgi:hypothetical protein
MIAGVDGKIRHQMFSYPEKSMVSIKGTITWGGYGDDHHSNGPSSTTQTASDHGCAAPTTVLRDDRLSSWIFGDASIWNYDTALQIVWRCLGLQFRDDQV